MKRIAIISDTHGLLRNEVKEKLEQADLIIHAGDINNQVILDQIQNIASLYVVRGNNDKEWAEQLPQTVHMRIEGVNFFVVHNKKDLPQELPATDVVIYGHSHKYEEKMVNGVLMLNPGSCGRRRFDLEITMCLMTVDGDHYTTQKVILQK